MSLRSEIDAIQDMDVHKLLEDYLPYVIERQNLKEPKSLDFMTFLKRKYQKDANERYNLSDFEVFMTNVYNDWRRYIIDMPDKTFNDLLYAGKLDKSFIKFREALIDFENPEVPMLYEDFQKFLSKVEGPLHHLFKSSRHNAKKYDWCFENEANKDTHISSTKVSLYQTKNFRPEHRLFINIGKKYYYDFVKQLYAGYKKKNIPFYFKYKNPDGNPDTEGITIFCSSDYLEDNLNIIDEIITKNPKLAASIAKPAPYMGRIREYVGYGSEPPKDKMGNRQSYTDIRGKLLEETFEKATRNYFIKHRDDRMTIGDEEKPLYVHVARKAFANFMRQLKDTYEETLQNTSGLDLEEKKKVVVESLGYSLDDLEAPNFKDAIYNIFEKRMHTDLVSFCQNGANDYYDIVINVRHGKRVSFKAEKLNYVLNEFTSVFAKNEEFYMSVQNGLQVNCLKYGIASHNLALDNIMLARMSYKAENKVTEKSLTDIDYYLELLNVLDNIADAIVMGLDYHTYEEGYHALAEYLGKYGVYQTDSSEYNHLIPLHDKVANLFAEADKALIDEHDIRKYRDYRNDIVNEVMAIKNGPHEEQKNGPHL